jgi:hypothetical protein
MTSYSNCPGHFRGATERTGDQFSNTADLERYRHASPLISTSKANNEMFTLTEEYLHRATEWLPCIAEQSSKFLYYHDNVIFADAQRYKRARHLHGKLWIQDTPICLYKWVVSFATSKADCHVKLVTHTQNRHISVPCAAAFCQQWRKFVDIWLWNMSKKDIFFCLDNTYSKYMINATTMLLVIYVPTHRNYRI